MLMIMGVQRVQLSAMTHLTYMIELGSISETVGYINFGKSLETNLLLVADLR